MLLDSTPKLEDLIVEMLAISPADAFSLHQKLVDNAHEFTIQAIYKSLRILERDGVVIKSKTRYSLRIPWVIDLKRLASEASKNLRNEVALPKTGKRIIWHFNDLLALNNFWSQVLLQMIGQSKNRHLYTWMPHPWFHLAYSEQEEQYIRSLHETGTKLKLINGGNTFLDKWAEKYWQDENIEYSNSTSYFHDHKRHEYLNVFDNYVLIVKLDDKITAEIENFYNKISSFDDLDFSEVFRIFGTRVRASMWLENNADKAGRLKKKFTDYFG